MPLVHGEMHVADICRMSFLRVAEAAVGENQAPADDQKNRQKFCRVHRMMMQDLRNRRQYCDEPPRAALYARQRIDPGAVIR